MTTNFCMIQLMRCPFPITVVYNNCIYIFGGFNGIHDEHFNDLYCFDPALNRWGLVESVGRLPCPRRRHVSLVIDDRVYIFGGTRWFVL